jgi:hypothetical protein
MDKYESLDDLREDMTDDEEKLIAHFLKKREEKAKFAEGVRER